jgi:hypothetical protein
VIILAVVMFVLCIGAGFVGFQGILGGYLGLLMKALFLLFGLVYIIALNVVVLRRINPGPPVASDRSPAAPVPSGNGET